MMLERAGAGAAGASAAEPELEISVVIPCLDEAETLAGLAQAAGARVVEVASRGYGNALASGIAAARGRYVLMGDADGSYDFGELPKFLAALRGGADLVMGCRLPAGGGSIQAGAMPWKHRWIGNPLLTAVGRLFFTAPVHDFHCGLRAFRRDTMLALGL